MRQGKQKHDGDYSFEHMTANIETIAKVEEDLRASGSWSARLSDTIAGWIGTMKFVIVHVIWFVTWFLINTGSVPGIKIFDPFPFVLLTMTLSMEGVLLAMFVLMKQNRMSRQADHRDRLNLQIDLMAEKEITKLIQMMQSVCHHLGLKDTATEPEVQEFSKHTAVESLAKELKEKIPE